MTECTIDQLIEHLEAEKERNNGDGSIKVVIPNPNSRRFREYLADVKRIKTIRGYDNQPVVFIN